MFFFQAEDGIRDLVRSRGLGDVYKRQVVDVVGPEVVGEGQRAAVADLPDAALRRRPQHVDLSLIHI